MWLILIFWYPEHHTVQTLAEHGGSTTSEFCFYRRRETCKFSCATEPLRDKTVNSERDPVKNTAVGGAGIVNLETEHVDKELSCRIMGNCYVCNVGIKSRGFRSFFA